MYSASQFVYIVQQSGVPFSSKIWSLTSLKEKQYHRNVIDAHKAYINAGCDIITTNNYCAVPLYLELIDEVDKLEFYTKVSVDLANSARKECNTSSSVSIAGSIPPLMNSYRNDLIIKNDSKSKNYYSRILDAFQSDDTHHNVDILQIETMSATQEAKNILDTLQSDMKYEKDIGLYFALREDGLLRDGNNFNDMMEEFADNKYFDQLPMKYIGINCFKPEVFDDLMQSISINKRSIEILNYYDILIGCYPNKYVDIPKEYELLTGTKMEIRDEMTSKILYQHYFKPWITKYNNKEYRFGVLGGCCGINPENMKYCIDNIHNDFAQPKEL